MATQNMFQCNWWAICWSNFKPRTILLPHLYRLSESLPTNLVSLRDESVSEESPSEIVTDCLEINSNYHDLNSFDSIMRNRKPNNICIFHINIRSLRENIDKLTNMLSTMQKPPHIVAVSETKINKKDGCHFQIL